MDRSIEEKMEEAREYFIQRAAAEPDAERRRLHEYFGDMAESVRETVRLVEYLKAQVEEVRHALGRHVEVSGKVPHTHR